MYNLRSRGRMVLTGSTRSHRGMGVSGLPTELSPSQAMDVLESQEAVPDTEVSQQESDFNVSDVDETVTNVGTEASLPLSSFRGLTAPDIERGGVLLVNPEPHTHTHRNKPEIPIRDMEGAQNSKSRSRDPFTTHFDLILHYR